jgi:hypothetical protein
LTTGHPLARFEPQKLARYEQENYASYYQKRWLKLLRASVGMVKQAYALSLPQAIYGASLVARAEIAYAPFPDNDRPKAERTMGRFFAFIQRVHGLTLDVERAARLEVDWWDAHRRLFGQAENEALVQALVEAYAAFYGVPAERLRPAALGRARAMLLSDQWVNGGKLPNSPMLAQVEEELCHGYTALKAALVD